MPDIPTGTGTGTGDLDAIFDKSLGDFDSAMEGEREVIAAAGGGSAKAAGQREQSDADAVAGVDDRGYETGETGGGSSPATGGEGRQGTAGPPGGSAQSGSGVPGSPGQAGQGGTTPAAGEPGSGTGTGEPSGSDGKPAVKLPDDIPVDGSGDDVVGRQIREAAISMQETNPEAAEKLWDEYRKHTGIK